jgi:hypothetical protein
MLRSNCKLVLNRYDFCQEQLLCDLSNKEDAAVLKALLAINT